MMTTRSHGEHLLENAAGFLAGARHLSRDDRHSREILLHHIACAIELSLKSLLQFRGWSDERCRLEIRHDLTKALDAAEGLGLHPSYPDLHSPSRSFRPTIAATAFAISRHEPALLSPQQALKAAEELLGDVRAACSKGSGLGGPSSRSP